MKQHDESNAFAVQTLELETSACEARSNHGSKVEDHGGDRVVGGGEWGVGHQVEWDKNTVAISMMRGCETALVHKVFTTLHSGGSVFTSLTRLNSINEGFYFMGETSHPHCDAVGKCGLSVCGINETRKL